jgi:U3 small nucleolar RNA-associated protein 22
MAQHPIKRRKLEHDGDSSDADAASSNESMADNSSASDESDNEDQPSKAHKKTPVKAPRTDVDSSAMYAGESHKSSIFKMQVDEMLAEVRPNYEKRMAPVNEALRKLKVIIESLGDREPMSVSCDRERAPPIGISVPNHYTQVVDATKSIHKSHKIVIPYPDPKPKKDAAYKLSYSKPSGINVTGSYALRTMTKTDHDMAVDLIVNMPASIFQEKDYLNYRYFYKRAYYLACIAAGIQDATEKAFVVTFDYLNGNTLLPILVVKPATGETPSRKTGIMVSADNSLDASEFASAKCNIHIIPTCPESLFATTKLQLSKNAIRPKDSAGQDTPLPPTPFYNSSVMSEAAYAKYLKLLHLASKQAEGFRDACVLGRIWLRQRGFGASISKGGFGHFEWAALTALLLQGGGTKGHSVLSPGYSSYQLFKAVIQYLASTDLITKPMLYQSSDVKATKSDTPMFYDGPRGVNVLYKMSAWSYQTLRDEAKSSLEMLNDAVFDQFEATFILRTDNPLQKFDALVKIPLGLGETAKSFGDHADTVSRISSKIYRVLKEGLTDRAKIIDIKTSTQSSWPLKASATETGSDSSVLVGIVFDPANSERIVDHGPPAEEKKKAAAFQNFWGEKAELRRFKDGSIMESVVWTKSVDVPVYQQIVVYLLARHLGIETAKNTAFVGQDFHKLLPMGATETFANLREAYKTLEKDFRDLESLPLQLRQLSPIDAQLRSTSIVPPVFSEHQHMKTPADVVIQFEGSGRWPDDVIAIQRTKMAFLLKIGDLLEEAVDGLVARVGLENADAPLLNCAFLDVKYPSGAIFRLRIHNEREQTLLERQVKDKSSDSRAREEAVAALALYKRMYIQLPLHTQSVATHCTRFPLLSPTIRLTKKWFNSHLLSGHVSEELVELLAIRAFLQPYPWRAPSSAMAGFLRTLQFLSRWDWRLTPLVVDFGGTMTTDDVAAINTRLEAWRKIDPAMNRTVIMAASSHDLTGTAFTGDGPSKVVAARMTSLARSACKIVKDQGASLDPKSLFASSTADYDFVIHISPKLVAGRKKKSSKQQFKNLEVREDENLEDVGFEPIQLFIEDLKAIYTTSIVLFQNSQETSYIAGLWNPQTASRPFKVNLGYATKPSASAEETKALVDIDKSVILAEIARLGGDMVTRIDVK